MDEASFILSSKNLAKVYRPIIHASDETFARFIISFIFLKGDQFPSFAPLSMDRIP
jgi:hypothetical protein